MRKVWNKNGFVVYLELIGRRDSSSRNYFKYEFWDSKRRTKAPLFSGEDFSPGGNASRVNITVVFDLLFWFTLTEDACPEYWDKFTGVQKRWVKSPRGRLLTDIVSSFEEKQEKRRHKK